MNFSMFRGDTSILNLAVTQDGVPVNIAGATIWMTAKRSVEDPDTKAVFQAKTPDDIEIVDGAAGLAKITIPAGATASVILEHNQPLNLAYDVQIKTATGIVSTIDGGTVTLLPDVTRAIS